MKINLNNYEEYFFNAVENNLTAEQKAEVDLFLALHPELQDQFDAWKHSVLPVESEIVFANKKLLLKPEPGRTFSLFSNFYLWSAVAAGLLLLLILKIFIPQTVTDSLALVSDKRVDAIEQKEYQPAIPNPQPYSENHFAGLQLNYAVANQIQFISVDTNRQKQHPTEIILAANNTTPLQINSHPRVVKLNYKSFGAAQEPEKISEVESWFSVAGIALTQIWKLSGHADLLQNENQLKLAANKTIDLTINTRLIKLRKQFSLFHKTTQTKK